MKIAVCLAHDGEKEFAAQLIVDVEDIRPGTTVEPFYPSLQGEMLRLAGFRPDWTLTLRPGHAFESRSIVELIESGSDVIGWNLVLTRGLSAHKA